MWGTVLYRASSYVNVFVFRSFFHVYKTCFRGYSYVIIQGNVIGSVCIYIYIAMCVQKKIVIERTRDLIYLKFVATDFFPKIVSPSAGENSGDLA